MKLEIRKEGDLILRQPTAEVTDFDFELQKLIDDMIETMRVEGMGLAAPQVGISKKLLVCEFAGDEKAKIAGFPLTVFANPKIIKKSQRQTTAVEGCISIPNREVLVRRPESITVAGLDRYGKKQEIKAKGLCARVLQHEIDHLNSTLIVDHLRQVRTIFISTGSLGVLALKLLASDPQYKIAAVVVGAGESPVRGKSAGRHPVLEFAQETKLPVIQTKKIRDQAVLARIKKLRPELGIIADFGQILPEELLSIPKFGIINIHPSLLPRHRGPSPVQATILAGDDQAGVSIMLTTKEMDAGPILSQAAVALSGSETAPILKDYLAEAGATLLLETLPYYLAGELKPQKQSEKEATYTKMIKKEDGLITGQTPAAEVYRRMRAFAEWPGIYVERGGKRIQITAAHFDESGKLILDRVRPEGKAEIAYAAFQNGYRQKLTFDE